MQESLKHVTETGDLRSSILRALAYSAVFNYPLNLGEIINGMDTHVTHREEVVKEVNYLCAIGMIDQKDGFYTIQPSSNSFEKRIERNLRATKYLRIARRLSRFIGSFPFVRAVFISGSLSKNSMDSDSDIDYFIITQPGRLWIARTLLVFFKKIFLFNSYKYFCVNYFIDTEHLIIEDRNIYTAHEIASLVPTYGKSHCLEFFSKNEWVYDYLPNYQIRKNLEIPKNKIKLLKWLGEKLLSRNLGDKLEKKFRGLSKKYWERKHNDLDQEDFDLTLVLEESKSSYHPHNFKFKVLNKLDDIMSQVEVDMEKQFEKKSV